MYCYVYGVHSILTYMINLFIIFTSQIIAPYRQSFQEHNMQSFWCAFKSNPCTIMQLLVNIHLANNMTSCVLLWNRTRHIVNVIYHVYYWILHPLPFNYVYVRYLPYLLITGNTSKIFSLGLCKHNGNVNSESMAMLTPNRYTRCHQMKQVR